MKAHWPTPRRDRLPLVPFGRAHRPRLYSTPIAVVTLVTGSPNGIKAFRPGCSLKFRFHRPCNDNRGPSTLAQRSTQRIGTIPEPLTFLFAAGKFRFRFPQPLAILSAAPSNTLPQWRSRLYRNCKGRGGAV
jgi:hypothetical protein